MTGGVRDWETSSCWPWRMRCSRWKRRRSGNRFTIATFGASFEIDERVRGFVGGTYQHISDAGIDGGGGGFDGPMLWAGVTFPF